MRENPPQWILLRWLSEWLCLWMYRVWGDNVSTMRLRRCPIEEKEGRTNRVILVSKGVVCIVSLLQKRIRNRMTVCVCIGFVFGGNNERSTVLLKWGAIWSAGRWCRRADECLSAGVSFLWIEWKDFGKNANCIMFDITIAELNTCGWVVFLDFRENLDFIF